MKRLVLQGNRDQLEAKGISNMDQGAYEEVEKIINLVTKVWIKGKTHFVDFDDLKATVWLRVSQELVGHLERGDEITAEWVLRNGGLVRTWCERAIKDFARKALRNKEQINIGSRGYEDEYLSVTQDSDSLKLTGKGSTGGTRLSTDDIFRVKEMISIVERTYGTRSPEYRYFVGQLALGDMLGYFEDVIPRDIFITGARVISKSDHAKFTMADMSVNTDKHAFQKTVPLSLAKTFKRYGYNI